jgi:hypothetical protein
VEQVTKPGSNWDKIDRLHCGVITEDWRCSFRHVEANSDALVKAGNSSARSHDLNKNDNDQDGRYD